ncbi:MAG: hypothetical protein RIK87_17860 [Fuerstiella sp.]
MNVRSRLKAVAAFATLLSPAFLLGYVILTAALLWGTFLPLGIPGEWEWQRHALWQSIAEAADRLLPVAVCGPLLLYFAVRTGARIGRASRLKTGTMYLLLTILSFGWTAAVQQSAPIGFREMKPYWVLYHWGSSGYFFEATFHMKSTEDFLSTYEARMRQGDVLHVGTHPPGLFLLSKSLLQACESSPTLVAVLQAIRNDEAAQAFRSLESAAAPRLSETELAALQLLSLLSSLAVAFTIVPLAVIANRLFDARTAWMLCCLWPTLPCLAVFLPKSDLLFPLTTMSVVAFMIPALDRWKAVLLAIPAGLVLWLGLMMSLAHLPVIVLLTLFAAFCALPPDPDAAKRGLTAVTLLLTTVVVAGSVWSWHNDCNIFAVWQLNLTNHEGFYGQFPRTWWKWIAVNPVELAFSVGLPLALAALGGLLKSARTAYSVLRHRRWNEVHRAAAFSVAAGITLVALWLSGKNQGEAARLWCFLTPWLLLAAGQVLRSDDSSAVGVRIWKHLLAAQLVVSVITASSVAGFSIG